jgi:hypothetical protein
MKEATGELNMTVVTVVAIAAVATFFYAFVWPSIKTNILNSTKCASATCPKTCTTGSTCTCQYINDQGTAEDVTCKIQND